MTTSQLNKHKSLIIKTAKQYLTAKGRVGWRRAFKENPELQATLGIKDMKDRHSLYVYIQNWRKTDTGCDAKLRKAQYQRTYRNRQNRQQKLNIKNNSVDSSSNSSTNVHFCPGCGTNLDAVNLAMGLTK